jgi:hypothetical protein
VSPKAQRKRDADTAHDRQRRLEALDRRRSLLELCWRVQLADGRIVECDIHRLADGLEVRMCFPHHRVIRVALVSDLDEAHGIAARWRRAVHDDPSLV